MPRNAHHQRSNLYHALLPTGLILGGLIIVAAVVVWLTTSSRADVPASDSGELNAEVMQKFRTQYDQLGVAIGNPDAPITIREFGDYQCPSCKAFEPTATRIREELVSTGKVRFVFFDFPLVQHQHSFEAAMAARCAARQDKFWAYHEALYANQSEWAALGDATSMFLDIAVQVGIDAQRLKQCLVQEATRDVVQRNRELAMKIGVRVTPTVIVGSRVFSGAVGYDRIVNIVKSQTGGKPTASE